MSGNEGVRAERLRASALGDDLSFLIARANALSLAAGNRALADVGLKVRSFSVLALTVGGERPSQRELGEFLRLDPSQVVALVDDLQDRGLVVREPDPADRRTRVIVATEAGQALFRRAQRATRAAERELHANLDDEERWALTRVLRRIAYRD